MGIVISQGFTRRGDFAIDDTLTLTKAEMLAMDDDLMPDKYFTICQDDGKIYLYNKEGTPSATTGKFKLFEGSGGTGGTSDYEELVNLPSVNNNTLIGNKTGHALGLVDESSTITNSEIDTIIYG